MTVSRKYRGLFQHAVSIAVVLTFFSVMFAAGGPCLCSINFQSSAIESGSCCHKGDHHDEDNCCGNCIAGVHHESGEPAPAQILERLPEPLPLSASSEYLSNLNINPVNADKVSISAKGPPSGTGPAVHIRSTVLLI